MDPKLRKTAGVLPFFNERATAFGRSDTEEGVRTGESDKVSVFSRKSEEAIEDGLRP
jgi:hypothetical protein